MTESHSQPAITLTYDPSGTPSVSGSANGWPFLYHGMEQEPTYDPGIYNGGNGSFYNPQMQRSISQIGAQGASGPGIFPTG
jgi:hypothetical protein